VQEVHRSYTGDDAVYRRRLDDAAAIVQEEVATLRRLVGEFSEFARLPEVHVVDADLNQFVREAERSLNGLQEELGTGSKRSAPTEVRVQLSESSLPVRIDAMMLRRCLDNLVRNAMQAIRHHGHDSVGHVRIRTRLIENRAVLEVSDDGPGISRDDRLRVFDPYFTTKVEGTGLGLAIVKKIVIEHGGEVLCRDGDLGGATFEIRIPIRGRD
jgi:signal transduction histidine kinase